MIEIREFDRTRTLTDEAGERLARLGIIWWCPGDCEQGPGYHWHIHPDRGWDSIPGGASGGVTTEDSNGTD